VVLQARKHSLEEKDALLDVIHHPDFKVVVSELERLAQECALDVVKFDLGTGDERELIRRKSRAEGAAMLVTRFAQSVASLKAKHKA
jgi:hypothetical protein